MKRIFIIAALVLAVFLIIRSCGGNESTSGQGGGKVEPRLLLDHFYDGKG